MLLGVSFSIGRLSTSERLQDSAGIAVVCGTSVFDLQYGRVEVKTAIFFSLFEQQPNSKTSAECCGLRLVSAWSIGRRLVSECVTKLICIP